MPFPMIPGALGACFFLVWLFIGGMLFRDCLLAARRANESDAEVVPHAPHRAVREPAYRRSGVKRGKVLARVAS